MALTDQELSWIGLALKSTAETREQLQAGETPSAKALYELCNRVEALIWHLAKRDTLPPAIRAILEAEHFHFATFEQVMADRSTNTP